MKRLPLAALAVAAALPGSAHAVGFDGPIPLRSGGATRVFEIACDELHCSPAAGAAHAVAIARQADAAATVALADARSGAGGARYDLVLYEVGKAREPSHRRTLGRRVLVEMGGGRAAAEIARAAGASSFEVPRYSPRHLILSFAAAGDALAKLDALRALPGVLVADPLLGRQKLKRLTPDDPKFAWSASNPNYQWHLNNTGQNGSTVGHDVNISGVWDSYLGDGVTISIVDDGLQVAHPDLSANTNTAIDHNWNDPATPDDPTPPNTFDEHGTSCAGIAAARGGNATGVTGAAPHAALVGLRLVAAVTTDAEDAEAIGWRTDVIDVSSNSWGQADNGREFYTAGPLITAALRDGVANGRGGRGTIYVWASGNGRHRGDYANYDGYVNAIETIGVGSVDYSEEQPYYSESGANLLLCAPSSGDNFDPAITTTTLVERGSYTDDFGGTSASAPLVSGIVALLLEANPLLGWRDVQEILVRSAVKVDAADPGWSDNGAGLHFHHGFGAGMVDAAAAVALAESWRNLPAQQSASVASGALDLPIPDNNAAGVDFALELGGTDLRVEHARLTVDIDHSFRGNLVITLTSPAGTVSRFSEVHSDDGTDIENYTFLSVRHWGEMSSGSWAANVRDASPSQTGSVRALALEVLGSEPPGGYELWARGVFTQAQLEAPQTSDPLADPDGDRRSNLYEYAVGGAPLTPDQVGDPVQVAEGGSLRFRYLADTAKTDISYRAQVATDLTDWADVAETVVATDGALETREITLSGDGRCFARLLVTR